MSEEERLAHIVDCGTPRMLTRAEAGHLWYEPKEGLYVHPWFREEVEWMQANQQWSKRPTSDGIQITYGRYNPTAANNQDFSIFNAYALGNPIEHLAVLRTYDDQGADLFFEYLTTGVSFAHTKSFLAGRTKEWHRAAQLFVRLSELLERDDVNADRLEYYAIVDDVATEGGLLEELVGLYSLKAEHMANGYLIPPIPPGTRSN